MFEPKTIVTIEVVEIHPDFVEDIGRKIASACNLKFKEKNGKFFITQGIVLSQELTVEVLTKLIKDRIDGKEWSAVSNSAIYKIAEELELFEFIGFRKPKKNLLDQIT